MCAPYLYSDLNKPIVKIKKNTKEIQKWTGY